MNDNKGRQGIEVGNQPSLRQQAIADENKRKQEEQAAQDAKAQEQRDRGANLSWTGAKPTPGIPQETMETATGSRQKWCSCGS